jgi:hypothetical protein
MAVAARKFWKRWPIWPAPDNPISEGATMLVASVSSTSKGTTMFYPDNPKVTFSAKLGNHDIRGDVINPGDWFGKVCVIEVGFGVSSFFYAVEADGWNSAIDEFVDSERGHLIRISEDDMADYDEDEVRRAGNACEPVDLENAVIHDIPVKYHGDHLPADGVTPEQYQEMLSDDELESEAVWGESLEFEPGNPSRYIPVKYPVTIQDGMVIQQGDFVAFGPHGDDGRVFGIVTRFGTGKDAPELTFLVLVIDREHKYTYWRFVPATGIKSKFTMNPLLKWFYSSNPDQDVPTVASLQRHGSLSQRFISKYLDDNGELRVVDPPFNYKAICAAAGE